jgi:heavy metal translocating P-type ATPase
MRVDAEPAAGVIQRLVKSVREAANQTCRPQRLADRLATFFVPIVFVIAVIVFVAHWKSSNLNTAFMSSMAVALIACPCALAIATPLAIWAALANAAKHGVVFRTSEDLSALSDVDYVCIDKTGTLTTDEPRLAGQWYEDDESQDAVRDIAIQLAAQSLHPLAAALGKWLDHPTGAGNISIAPAILRPGRGVCAELTIPSAGDMELSTMAALGSSQFCVELRFDISERLRRTRDEAIEHGLSVTCVGWDSQVRAVFAFEESLRPDAAASVRALRIRGLDTMLLTGDQTERAKRIAAEIDVSLAANLLPGDKLRIVSELQAEGHHVAMLGDGLNDAPALSAADVGIALGCGADVTRDAADVCLLSPAPALLPWAIDLARTTQRTIRRNLIWAVGYNSIGIALAASGRLNPIFAALAMVFSSAFVIAESLRLAALPGPVSQVSLEHTAASRDHIHSGQTELLAAGVPSQ